MKKSEMSDKDSNTGNEWRSECGCKHRHHRGHASGGNAVYSLGMIGALIYYITTASGFWVGALGVLKAIVWPAFVVFELMKYLHL